jgi:hypothetical protein
LIRRAGLVHRCVRLCLPHESVGPQDADDGFLTKARLGPMIRLGGRCSAGRHGSHLARVTETQQAPSQEARGLLVVIGGSDGVGPARVAAVGAVRAGVQDVPATDDRHGQAAMLAGQRPRRARLHIGEPCEDRSYLPCGQFRVVLPSRSTRRAVWASTLAPWQVAGMGERTDDRGGRAGDRSSWWRWCRLPY